MTVTLIQLFALISTVTAGTLAVMAMRRKQAAAAAQAGREVTRGNPLRALVRPLASRMLPTSQADLEILNETLAAAGRRDRDAVLRFTEERVISMVAGCVGALFAIAFIGDLFGLLMAVIAVSYGFVGPHRKLRLVAKIRQDKIQRALPSGVDLLTTCVDAGLSLQHALARVAREIGASYPLLAEELTLTASEIDAGVPVADALRRMSRRVRLDELSALCGVIAQAHGLGAPIGRTLSDYASTSRRQRMSMLEERAGKLAAQLVMPLALFLLPAALLTIIGPSVLQLIEVFSR